MDDVDEEGAWRQERYKGPVMIEGKRTSHLRQGDAALEFLASQVDSSRWPHPGPFSPSAHPEGPCRSAQASGAHCTTAAAVAWRYSSAQRSPAALRQELFGGPVRTGRGGVRTKVCSETVGCQA